MTRLLPETGLLNNLPDNAIEFTRPGRRSGTLCRSEYGGRDERERQARELSPNEPKYAYMLAFYLYQRGEVNAAIEELEGMVERGSVPGDAYPFLGQVDEEHERLDEPIAG